MTSKFTPLNIMAEEPCKEYPMERIIALWAGRDAITAEDIASMDIPFSDRIWILSRLLYRLSPHRANRCTRLIALSVDHLWKCPDIVWWYLVTGDETARDAARDVAWSAAWDAVFAVAWSAAWDAVFAAARAAARDAAWDAALAAARAAWSSSRAAGFAARAAWDAARAAALDRHLGTMVEAFG